MRNTYLVGIIFTATSFLAPISHADVINGLQFSNDASQITWQYAVDPIDEVRDDAIEANSQWQPLSFSELQFNYKAAPC